MSKDQELGIKQDRNTLRALSLFFDDKAKKHLKYYADYGTHTEVLAKIYEADEKISGRNK